MKNHLSIDLSIGASANGEAAGVSVAAVAE